MPKRRFIIESYDAEADATGVVAVPPPPPTPAVTIVLIGVEADELGGVTSDEGGNGGSSILVQSALVQRMQRQVERLKSFGGIRRRGRVVNG